MIIIIFVVICMQSGCEKMIAMSDLDLIKLNLYLLYNATYIQNKHYKYNKVMFYQNFIVAITD